MYRTDKVDAIYSFLERTTSTKDSSITLRMALFDKEHRRGTHIVFLLMCFMMLTGIDGLNIFSNRIITNMNQGKDVIVSANTATAIFGWINFISAFLSLFIVQYFGRV